MTFKQNKMVASTKKKRSSMMRIMTMMISFIVSTRTMGRKMRKRES